MKKYTSQEIEEFISGYWFNEEVVLRKDPAYPKISIVTPSYNQAQFFEKTILSVLNQNYPNLEYIIIDGGSTDGSVEIIRKYEKYLAYWISEKDSGQTDAINKGFRIATGEIFAWINSDDTYLPGTFSKVAKAFQQHSEADLMYGNIHFISEDDRIIGELRLTKLDITHFVFEGISLAQQAVFFTKDIYNKVGGLNLQYQFCMDFDLFIRITDIGNLWHITEYLANFRIHKDSKTSTNSDTWRIEHDEIIKRYLPQNADKTHFIYKKNLCRLRRILYYLMQGDIKYVLRKCVNRLGGVAFWDELR